MHTVKQLLRATRRSAQLAEQLAEMVDNEMWKQQLALYLEDIQRQYQLWQYIHHLLAGAYEESVVEEKTVKASVADFVHALCCNELEKGMLCQRASEKLSGAARKAADQSLQQAIQYSRLFFTMMQTQLVPQIER
ncbi:hypothetical protein A7K69_11860 [Parageobacillus thermoglucosidasius]|uniref:Uncharacterized protein n=2 Tax=Anoxybacillaceae TaxID=3120669 RepID=A0A1B7KQ96_PARTM|nr:hypothetical protein A7K69_11860 [Parageobacillus thermoglucosidasius]